jgi:hypothetical protein
MMRRFLNLIIWKATTVREETMRMGVSSLRYVAATCCAVVEGAVVEGAVVEGAVVEGALVEGAVVEGAVVEGQHIEMVTWSHSVV